MTHPGVGPLTALAFVMIMGRVDRFQCGKQIATIFYLQTDKVRLTVVSKTGKEATIGVLSDGSFFGEGRSQANLSG